LVVVVVATCFRVSVGIERVRVPASFPASIPERTSTIATVAASRKAAGAA
jgi:hypothetical protein